MKGAATAMAPQVSEEGQARIRQFYESYYMALESRDFSGWSEHFGDEAYYTVQSASNRQGRFPICDIFCDSRGMIDDRAAALRSTTVFEDRIIRYFLGNIRLTAATAYGYEVQTSYLAVESVADEPPVVFSVGQTFDVITHIAGRLLLARREVVYDHTAIRNSLIVPL